MYLKRVLALAVENNGEMAWVSITTAAIGQMVANIFKLDIFGVPNFLLLLVISTVLIDAYYGVKKSVKKSRENLAKAYLNPENSPERKALLKISALQKFQPLKLQFTFFKCLTLLGYLYFVRNIMEVSSDGTTLAAIVGFASGVVTKAPLAIFWYYDFKSIGDNSSYVFGKKAPIFIIVEKIFEPKINEFFNAKKEE